MAINKRKILESAQKYFQKGAYDKALKEYRALLEADPRDSNVRLKVGDIHLRLGQKDEAIAAYLKVANGFMHDGFDAKAVALFKQITKIDPARVDVCVSLAELYQRLGLTSEAMAALQTAADAFHKQGRKREALELLRKMASFDPTNTTSRLKIADLLKQADLRDEALAEYEEVAAELERQGEQEALAGVWERVLEIDPKRQPTLLAMARHLLANGTPERALALARRSVEVHADALEGWELLAESQRELGRTEEMEETYRRLAELYRGRGDEDRARAILQRFVAVEPLGRGVDEEPAAPPESPFGKLDDHDVLDDPALHFENSLGGANAGATAAAELPALREAEPPAQPPPAPARAPLPPPDLGPLDPEQVLAEASVYLRYGKHEKALASLESLLARDPNNRVALEKFGEALVVAGSPERAVEAYSEAAKLARDAGDAAALESLHERLVELDPEAAARVAPPAAPPLREPPVASAPSAPAPEAVEPSLGPPGEPEPELELDLDVDVDLDLESPAPGEVEAPAAPAERQPTPMGVDTLEDAAGALGAELEAAAAGAPAPPAAARRPAVQETEPALDGGASNGSSSTTPQQILEDLEEADFYLHQGLLDEAEVVYRRILAAAPGHPQALLRMGEIAAARGQDPGAASEGAPPPEAVDSTPVDGAESDGLDDLADDLLRAEPSSHEAGQGADTESVQEDGAAESGLGLDLPEVEVDLEAPVASAAAAGVTDTALEQGAAPQPDELSLETHEDAADAASHDLSELLEDETEEPEPAAPEAPARTLAARADPPAPSRGSDETARETTGPEETPFDLAAELSEAFAEEPAADDARSAAGTDDAFAAIFREFKKGVSRTLSEGDHETHYDLGIAYREMGLFEDAIGEFRVALESPKRRIDCLHMLGLCALDLKRPQDAVAHLEQALALPGVPELQQTAIRYDLGRAFESAGDAARARAAYQAVAEVEAGFQDVDERLARLAAGGGAAEDELADDASLPEVAPRAEAFESFDDLIAEARETEERDDEPRPGPPSGRSQPAAGTPEAPKAPARRRRISFG